MTTTAVVLARGLGTRMRARDASVLTAEQAAAAEVGHKALMPVGRHRLIDHSLSALADAGIERAVLVVASRHDDFRAHLDRVRPTRLRVDLAVQQEPRGTADALAAARDVVGDERFLLVNGDNLYPRDGLRALRAEDGHALLGFERRTLTEGGNIPAERIGAFALVRHEGGRLRGIVEKPDAEQVALAGEEALVSMNCFAFTPEVFTACTRISPSPRGELEIVDAVRALDAVSVLRHPGPVLDLSRRTDVAAVQALLADDQVAL